MVNYLMDELEVERWVLAGTDYVYPRTTNKVSEQYLKDSGVAASDIMINYTPFGHSDWQTIVSDIKTFRLKEKRLLWSPQLMETQMCRFTKNLEIRESQQKIFLYSRSLWAKRGYLDLRIIFKTSCVHLLIEIP